MSEILQPEDIRKHRFVLFFKFCVGNWLYLPVSMLYFEYTILFVDEV